MVRSSETSARPLRVMCFVEELPSCNWPQSGFYGLGCLSRLAGLDHSRGPQRHGPAQLRGRQRFQARACGADQMGGRSPTLRRRQPGCNASSRTISSSSIPNSAYASPVSTSSGMFSNYDGPVSNNNEPATNNYEPFTNNPDPELEICIILRLVPFATPAYVVEFKSIDLSKYLYLSYT